jgi:AsmA-like C-terminal region
VAAGIPGVKDKLLLPTADARFNDTELVLIGTARFEHLPMTLSGSVSSPLNCQPEGQCALDLDLRTEELTTADISSVLGPEEHGWTAPFISRLMSDRLPDFRARGTVTIGRLKIGALPLEKFIAHLEVGDHNLVINDISTRIADGLAQGEWRVDWHASPVRYTATGILTGVSPERLTLPEPAGALLASWISGKTRVKYSLNLAGATGAEMLAGSQGEAEFVVANGLSRALTLESAKPVRFQNLEGTCTIDHGVLKLNGSKFKAENRIYEISGTISLADKQAKLKVTNSASEWHITGGLEKPKIAAQRLAARVQ